jgi:hypothetical protein
MQTYLRVLNSREQLIELFEAAEEKDECSFYLMLISHLNNKLNILREKSYSEFTNWLYL